MHQLTVQTARYVDDSQPGWIACEFVDAEGRRHTIIDKVPIATSELLGASSVYPQPGSVACKELKRWQDREGRELVRITTEPFGVESTEAPTGFTVAADFTSYIIALTRILPRRSTHPFSSAAPANAR